MKRFRSDLAMEVLAVLPSRWADREHVMHDLCIGGLQLAVAAAELIDEWGFSIEQWDGLIRLTPGQADHAFITFERYQQRRRQARMREAAHHANRAGLR